MPFEVREIWVFPLSATAKDGGLEGAITSSGALLHLLRKVGLAVVVVNVNGTIQEDILVSASSHPLG
jgi:hypothetical protein